MLVGEARGGEEVGLNERHVSEQEPGGLQHTQLSDPRGESETNQDFTVTCSEIARKLSFYFSSC